MEQRLFLPSEGSLVFGWDRQVTTDLTFGLKWCNMCEDTLPVSEFFHARTYPSGLSAYCATHERERAKTHNRRRRLKFLDDMGGCCATCGFSDPRALQVDHINSDGASERAEKGFRHDSNKWYAHVLAHPDRYQLLCANCNQIKRIENDETTGPKTLRNKPTHRFNEARNMKKFQPRGPSYLDGSNK